MSWVAALATSRNVGGLQTISIAFLAPIPWLAPLATSPKLGRLQKIFNRISHAHIVTRGTRNISNAWSTSKSFNRLSRANIVTSGTRNISNLWSTSNNFNRISRGNIVTSGTRNISKALSTWNNINRISRANDVTSATRNISKAWSTSKNFNRISRANIVTSATRNISKAWSTSKNFNRISRANIVTSATRNISKAWSTSKKFQSHFSRQYRDLRHSHHLWSLVDFKKIQSHFSHQYRDYSGISFFLFKTLFEKIIEFCWSNRLQTLHDHSSRVNLLPEWFIFANFFPLQRFHKTAVHLGEFRRLSFQMMKKEACYRVQHVKISRNWSSSFVGRFCAGLKNQTFERQWKMWSTGLNACNLGYGGQRTRVSHRCHGKHGEHRKNCTSGTVIE